MLRGYRNELLALGCVALLALLVAVWSWPSFPHLEDYGVNRPENPQYRPGGEACQPSRIAALKDRVEASEQAVACQKEAEEYRQNASDLVQQTRAADAAEAQAEIASQALWMTWFQTLRGLLTLAAAGAAAWYARDAAAHTRDSVVETKRIGEAQTRAYLSIVEAGATLINNVPKVSFNLENSGQSPALEIKISVELTILRLYDGPSESVLLTRTLPSKVSVPANGTFEVPPHALDELPSQYRDFKHLSVMLKVECDWQDVFKVRQSGKGVFGTVLHELPDRPFDLPNYHALLASLMNEKAIRVERQEG